MDSGDAIRIGGGHASGTRRFLYDGDALVAEYSGTGTLLRRYVHGLGAGDDAQVWFEGAGVTDAARRYLYADERGSIVAVTDGAGNVLAVNRYDEHGIPAPGNLGAFQYTGQAWLPELGMYPYKARLYSPTLGRFMQTDPIGYGDGMNMYAYVGGDPVNKVDPSGKAGADFCRSWYFGEQSGMYWNAGMTCFGDAYGMTPEYYAGMCRFYGLPCIADSPGPPPSVPSGGASGTPSTPVNTPGPPSEQAPQNETYCEGGGASTWATVADYAETIGAAADAGALGAAGIGLILAPTGAGFAAAELTALGLKGVAFAANATAAVANWQAGNNGRAVGNLVGAAAGAGVGSVATRGLGRYYASGRMFRNLSAGQVRYANYGGGVAGAVAGDAASGAAAAGCNAIRGR